MAFHIPEILAKESKNYILSIRLLPDGLSFSGYNPNIRGSFFFTEEKWQKALPYAEQLKEFYFENEFMTWNYKQIHIIQTDSKYTLVPLAFYLEKEQEKLFTFNCGQPEKGKILVDEVKEEHANLLYEMDNETFEFCSRSFTHPQFHHYMSSLLSLWKKQSQHNLFRRIYCLLSDTHIDLACYEQGRLLFANYYMVQSLNDMLYYILYVWKQHGWDAVHDQLYLSGDAAIVKELRTYLQTYLKQVDTIKVPAEVYLMGTDMLRAPIDLIALLLCE